MIKKILIALVIIVSLTALAIYSPWTQVDFFWGSLFGLEDPLLPSTLTISSLQGRVRVYLNGEEKGIADSESLPTEIGPLEPGEYEVKLVRIASSDEFYQPVVKNLNFEHGYNVYMAWEVGPSEEFSSGWIVSLQKKIDQTQTLPPVSIITEPEGVQVKIDNIEAGETPILHKELSIDTQHKVYLLKEGYDDLEFMIFPSEQKDREKLKDYNVVVEATLFRIPLSS